LIVNEKGKKEDSSKEQGIQRCIGAGTRLGESVILAPGGLGGKAQKTQYI
jgi:hypothetical protein